MDGLVNSLDRLILSLKNINQQDFDNVAISLFQNFGIKKVESYEHKEREVEYRFSEIEFYLYNKSTDDWPTYNRDCEAGQWFLHKSGVDLAFETQRAFISGEEELIQFGGILIRGLIKYVDGKVDCVIGGPQRCMFELFNATRKLPELVPLQNKADNNILKGKRVHIKKDLHTADEFRYYLTGVDWEMERTQIKDFKRKDGYYVIKGLFKSSYPEKPEELGTRVYTADAIIGET